MYMPLTNLLQIARSSVSSRLQRVFLFFFFCALAGLAPFSTPGGFLDSSLSQPSRPGSVFGGLHPTLKAPLLPSRRRQSSFVLGTSQPAIGQRHGPAGSPPPRPFFHRRHCCACQPLLRVGRGKRRWRSFGRYLLPVRLGAGVVCLHLGPIFGWIAGHFPHAHCLCSVSVPSSATKSWASKRNIAHSASAVVCTAEFFLGISHLWLVELAIGTRDQFDTMVAPLPRPEDYDVSPEHGFLPSEAPLTLLSSSYYEPWETVFQNLQGLVLSKRIRGVVDGLEELSTDFLATEAEWRRAYTVLGFLVHAYIWGGNAPADVS